MSGRNAASMPLWGRAVGEDRWIGAQFWRSVEALHDVVYFVDGDRFEALGLHGFWRGYFASRAAALGAPSAELVTATFFGFAPEMVARAVPEVWELADRDEVLAARTAIAVESLGAAWGERPSAVDEVVGPMVALLEGLDVAGKPLAAAHLALPRPKQPVARLWWAATVLRELHGDVHIAALVDAGVNGCEANAWALACGLGSADRQREVRGWTEERWAAAFGALRDRGWVDASGVATTDGLRARAELEERTHAAAERALTPAARTSAVALTEDLVGLARQIEAAGILPYPNPTAVERP